MQQIEQEYCKQIQVEHVLPQEGNRISLAITPCDIRNTLLTSEYEARGSSEWIWFELLSTHWSPQSPLEMSFLRLLWSGEDRAKWFVWSEYRYWNTSVFLCASLWAVLWFRIRYFVFAVQRETIRCWVFERFAVAGIHEYDFWFACVHAG